MSWREKPVVNKKDQEVTSYIYTALIKVVLESTKALRIN